ncbi:hypothetical protein [Sphingomonas sp. CFBP 8760]|uniref:hypothetical protein n=1 Tax=Sphingomonas sp. CFBP 8760 TaxID=2775282 RepID=UPI0017877412|nr:hypothetical protein [Sphingomonas sp. CFBP 8760]MBD8546769.1 hypothetical protein [Sphingomonas sp. CFBP 8760]
MAASAVLPASAQGAEEQPKDGLLLESSVFRISIDRNTGALISIINPTDTAAMSWVGGPQNAPWQPRSSLWGLGFADLGAGQLHRGRWGEPTSIRQIGNTGVVISYQLGSLLVEVDRKLVGDALEESYIFRNTGNKPISMRERGKASLAIYMPCNDHYTSATDVLENRAHAHIWTGGSSSWIAMLRMGGRAPHLGLVVTQGALDGYSIEDRDQVTLSNTRGTILVHPAIDTLQPGQSATVSWTMFWHKGWQDFFAQALRRSQQMVRIDASDWTSFPGETSTLTFQGQLGSSPALKIGDISVPLRRTSKGWQANVAAGEVGEHIATLRYGSGLATRAVLNTVPDLRTTVAARVEFIAQRQQWHKAGDPWDGAYIVFDNEADVPARWERASDRNSGRERVGMGVLLAKWLAETKSPNVEIRHSLDRYYSFVCSHLQREDGYVFDDADQPRKRLYNWPWVMQLHLAMSGLTQDAAPLRRFAATVESFYREGGVEFYPIGLPVAEGLQALNAAGMMAEHARISALFVQHGDRLMQRGTQYPASEVNYEQSIVAPAAIILLELHQATGNVKWLRGAQPHIELLELFDGQQPDHHLNGISIRHWDGYWFGKAKMWGDTFPHYWSSLNALAWDMQGRATGDRRWQPMARKTLRNNLSLFTADGRASAAFIYPTTVNGRPGYFADPYANDQDWTLVHALQLKNGGPV